MSWRTQGHYKGLSEKEQAWLEEFDRKWDTSAEGRNRTDAMDWAVFCGSADDLPLDMFGGSPLVDKTQIEGFLLLASHGLKRITVPRFTKSGWSIHLETKDGRKLRVRFEDEPTASQAYYAITELSFWFSMP